ncbi:MAG: hypothetical protein AAGF78_14545 [Pseudomonadota bacterium]
MIARQWGGLSVTYTRRKFCAVMLAAICAPAGLAAGEAETGATGKTLLLDSRYGTAIATVFSSGRVEVTSADGNWSGTWPADASRYCVFPSRAANVCIQIDRDEAGVYSVAGKPLSPEASVLVF